MTLARTWFREHWQQLVIAATALMVALIFAGTISALVTGRDTNRTVELQRATVDRAVCVSGVYSAWYTAVGDVGRTAAQGADPTAGQVAALDLAQDDLAHLNALCPAPAASIDP